MGVVWRSISDDTSTAALRAPVMLPSPVTSHVCSVIRLPVKASLICRIDFSVARAL